MSAWPQTVWSEAQQIVDRIGWPVHVRAAMPPDVYFAGLRDEGRLVEAVVYLAHALSRRDAIGWALACLCDNGFDRDDPVARVAAEWLDEASDAHRRAAERAGEQALPGSAGQLLASAIFLSGGSIADDGQAPVLPAPETCGRFVACAIVKAATHGVAFEQQIVRALDRGEAIARGNGKGF